MKRLMPDQARPDLEAQRLWWMAIAERVTLRPAWQLPMRWSIEVDRMGVMVHVEIDVPDIVTNEMQTVHQYHHVPYGEVDRLAHVKAVDLIARLIRRMVLHELDECLLVDGEQLSDPHSRDAGRVA